MFFFTPDENCPCGSGRIVQECCVPDEPMLVRKSTSSIQLGLNTQASIVDWKGNNLGLIGLSPRDIGMNFSFNMRKPEQLDPTIESVVHESINHEGVRANPDINLDELGRVIGDLRDVLHGARYHQQNFLYRLQKLNVEHSLNPNLVRTGNQISVVLEDAPLRYELEAFITKLITSLDVFAKVAAALLNKKFKVDKDYWGYLTSPKMKGSELHQIYDRRDWIKSLKNIRNAIAHDGAWEEYRSFRFEGNLFSQPSVKDRTAGYFVMQVWTDLLKMTSELLGELTKG